MYLLEARTMPHMSEEEEALRLSSEARWATIGRSIADGRNEQTWIEEAAMLRLHEQNSASRMMQFASLARQIGDAHHQHRDLSPLIRQIRELRSRELHG